MNRWIRVQSREKTKSVRVIVLVKCPGRLVHLFHAGLVHAQGKWFPDRITEEHLFSFCFVFLIMSFKNLQSRVLHMVTMRALEIPVCLGAD